MHIRKPPSVKWNTGPGQNLAPAVSIEITVPALDPGGWTMLTVSYATGLAQIGGRVQVVFPKGCGLWLCDAVVTKPNTIRFGVSNLTKQSTDEKTFEIQFHPAVRHRPACPEVNFESLDEVQF